MMEILLTISSMWAFVVLETGPSNFATFSRTFLLMQDVMREEYWGIFALIASALKATGVLLALVPRTAASGTVLRCFGLGMSAAFWSLAGFSTVVGNPDTLFGFNGILLGAAAWWSIVRLLQ
jgi:hypothetical protein